VIVPLSLFYIPFYTRRSTLERKIDKDKIIYEGKQKDRYVDMDYIRKLVCNDLKWLPQEVFDSWLRRLLMEGLVLKGRYTIGEKKIILHILNEELTRWYDNKVS